MCLIYLPGTAMMYIHSSNLIGPLPLNNLRYSMALFNTLSTHSQTSLVMFLADISEDDRQA